jgi:hypothetical protein
MGGKAEPQDKECLQPRVILDYRQSIIHGGINSAHSAPQGRPAARSDASAARMSEETKQKCLQ